MATFQPKFAIYILHIMRVQVVTILLLVLVIGCHAARNLRQVQAECPDELKRPVLDYTKSASYKDALAKACAKRDNPDCYLDCACTAYGAPGIVLAAAWGRRNPAQFKQYAQACGTMLVFEANALLPDYFKKETNTKVCTNRVRELSKDEPQT